MTAGSRIQQKIVGNAIESEYDDLGEKIDVELAHYKGYEDKKEQEKDPAYH
jgi:hypothetical protein